MNDIQKAIKKIMATPRSPERHSEFGRLPPELKTKIFDKLNCQQRKTLRLVCPSWRAIVDDKMSFSAVLDNVTFPWLQSSSCNLDLVQLTMQNLTEKIHNWSSLLQVQNFTIGKGNSSRNVLKFLSEIYTRAQRLTLQNLSMSDVSASGFARFLPKTQWECLGTLSITMGTKNALPQLVDQYPKHIKAIIAIFKYLTLQTLKCLTINMEYANERFLCENYNDFKKPIPEAISFLIRHKNSLRDLNMSVLGRPGPVARPSDLEYQGLTNLKLEKLHLNFDTRNTRLACAIALNVNKVKCLKIHETYWTDSSEELIDILCSMDSILRKHGPVLEKLETRTVSFPFLELEHLQPHLKILDIRTCFPVGISLSSNRTPLLKSVTKLTVFLLNAERTDLEDNLINLITRRFPNLVQVDAILIGEIFIFRAQHLQALLNLSSIRKIRIGERLEEEARDFCRTARAENELKSFVEDDSVLYDNRNSVFGVYHYMELHVNPKLRPNK